MALDIEASHFKIMLLKHSKVNCIGSFNVSNHVNNNNDNSCNNDRNINNNINDDINNNKSNHDINNNSSNSSNNTKIKTNGSINNNSSSSGSKSEFTESEHIDRNNNGNTDQKSVASEIFVAATESDLSLREPLMKEVQNQSNLPMQEVKKLPNKIPTSQQHKESLFNASSTRLKPTLDDVFNDSDDVFDDGSQENSHVTTSGNRCSNNATLPCKPLTLRRTNGTTLQLPPLQRLCSLPCKEGGQLLDLQFRMMAEFNEKRFAGVVQRFCPDSK